MKSPLDPGSMVSRASRLAEDLAQSVVCLSDGGACGGRLRDRVQHDEVVDGTQVTQRRDRHAGLDELAGVGLALVAEHVALAIDYERWRQAAQLIERRAQWRRRRLSADRNLRRVVIPEPLHRLSREKVALGELLVGRGIESGIRHRVEQHLEVDSRSTAFLGQQRDGRSHVAAHAVAGHGQTRGVHFDGLFCG